MIIITLFTSIIIMINIIILSLPSLHHPAGSSSGSSCCKTRGTQSPRSRLCRTAGEILMITRKESQQKLKLKNFTKFESLQIPTSLMSSSSAFSVGFIPIALIAHPSSFVLMFPPPSTSNSLKAWKSESESRNLRSKICVFVCIGQKQTDTQKTCITEKNCFLGI